MNYKKVHYVFLYKHKQELLCFTFFKRPMFLSTSLADSKLQLSLKLMLSRIAMEQLIEHECFNCAYLCLQVFEFPLN